MAKLTEPQMDALRFAEMNIYEGLASSWEAPEIPPLIAKGLIERDYSSPGGFLGLAKLNLTPAGRSALKEASDNE